MADLIDENQLNKIQPDSDESLMVRFQEGDEEAFHPLFQRYCSRVINFAYRFLNSKEEAEDIAQDVFLRLYRKKLSYDRTLAFRPWFFSIVFHLVSNKRRDKKRHPHHSLDWTEFNEDGSAYSPDSLELAGSHHGEPAEKFEIVRVVQSAINSLPKNQRTAVILARYEGMRYEEIAAAMGVSLSTVTSLLFRARQTLKKHLSEFTPSK